MADKLTAKRRSENMRRIKSQDTKPELTVRRLLHGFGYRYRLHCRDLPGRPDIVFPGRKIALFVHGCFWHGHENCVDGHIPKSRADYWQPKISSNRARDARNQLALESLGWVTLTVWECETSDQEKLGNLFKDELGWRITSAFHSNN